MHGYPTNVDNSIKLVLKSKKSSLIQFVVTAVLTQAAVSTRLRDFQAGLELIGSQKR